MACAHYSEDACSTNDADGPWCVERAAEAGEAPAGSRGGPTADAGEKGAPPSPSASDSGAGRRYCPRALSHMPPDVWTTPEPTARRFPFARRIAHLRTRARAWPRLPPARDRTPRPRLPSGAAAPA